MHFTLLEILDCINFLLPMTAFLSSLFIASFFKVSLVPFLFAVIIAVISPNMFVLLAVVTAFTVPWVNMVGQALLFISHVT